MKESHKNFQPATGPIPGVIEAIAERLPALDLEISDLERRLAEAKAVRAVLRRARARWVT